MVASAQSAQQSESAAVASSGYRPEIDGLRAVAVIVVLLFHLDVPGFGGGYVGVDVFFVISGYLITRLILAELEANRFAFGRFYGRRARRLAPALLATLTATFIGGVAVLSPPHLESLSESIVYTLVSLSNVLFWSSAGYFDVASHLKPLLHTWSLGVEEQFYLIWPVSIVLAFRAGRRRGVFILAATVLAVSLAAAERAAGVAPAAAFYLTPFRMCELALGALCLLPVRVVAARPVVREVLTTVGLATVAYAVVSYSAMQRFPGLAAMVPCIGTSLVIVSGHGRMAGLLLANRPAVGIGLISYSLYLVHWPLIVLARYGRPGAMTMTEKTVLLAVAVALATATYFGVERPLRARRGASRQLSDPAFGLACALCGFGLVLPAVAALTADGWPGRAAKDLRTAVAMLPTAAELADAVPLTDTKEPLAEDEEVDRPSRDDATDEPWPTAPEIPVATPAVEPVAEGRTDDEPLRATVDLPPVIAALDPASTGVAGPASSPAEARPRRRRGVIVGDSHGGELRGALYSAGSTVVYRCLHIEYFCQAVLGERPFGAGGDIPTREIAEECRQQSEVLRTHADLQKAETIVIASTWQDWGLAALPATIDFLKQTYTARIVVVDGRFFFMDPGEVLSRATTAEEANQLFDSAKDVEKNAKTIAALEAVAAAKGITFVDLRPYVCDARGGGWYCPLLDGEGRLLYGDHHHWTDVGKERAGAAMRADERLAFLF